MSSVYFGMIFFYNNLHHLKIILWWLILCGNLEMHPEINENRFYVKNWWFFEKFGFPLGKKDYLPHSVFIWKYKLSDSILTYKISSNLIRIHGDIQL